MSTRSYIGCAKTKRVVYCHYDGYSEAKLPELTALINRDGGQKVVETLLSARTGGWSYLDPKQAADGRNDLGDRAGSVEGYGLAYTDMQSEEGEPTYIGDGMSENDQIWIEWVYLIDPETGEITYWATSEPPQQGQDHHPRRVREGGGQVSGSERLRVVLEEMGEKMKDTSEVMTEARLEPSLGLEWVTPELAQHWLDTFNTENRNIKYEAVDRHLREIESGNWNWNGDTIRFDVRGILIDGQHRLLAIVRAGRAMRIGIARGIPTIARASIDTGVKRTGGDALAIEGNKNANVLSATLTLMILHNLGLMEHAGSAPTFIPTHHEQLHVLEEFPYLHEIVAKASAEYREIRLSAGVIALSRFLQGQVASQDQIEEFWYGACYTAGPGDARFTLRKWISTLPSESKKGRKGFSLQLFAIATSWNAWRDDRGLQRILPIARSEQRTEEGRIEKPTVWRTIPDFK